MRIPHDSSANVSKSHYQDYGLPRAHLPPVSGSLAASANVSGALEVSAGFQIFEWWQE